MKLWSAGELEDARNHTSEGILSRHNQKTIKNNPISYNKNLYRCRTSNDFKFFTEVFADSQLEKPINWRMPWMRSWRMSYYDFDGRNAILHESSGLVQVR